MFLLATDKLSPCQQHGFFRPKGNVILNNFRHLRYIGIGVSCSFTDNSGVVDDIPHLQWQMVWPLLYVGRCYANLNYVW